MNEEPLSSPNWGAKQLILQAIVWLASGVAIVVSFVRADQTGGTAFLALVLLAWIALTVPAAILMIRRPHRVTLRNGMLRIYRGFSFTDIALSRLRYVEHDFPGRGPRRVILSIEPDDPKERVLEIIEFVPRGGDSGLGGHEIADELRRRANEARGAPVAT